MRERRLPATGDIYLANLNPVRGSEQGKARPVVVFQAPELARFTQTFLCIPFTSNLRRAGIPGLIGHAQFVGARTGRDLVRDSAHRPGCPRGCVHTPRTVESSFAEAAEGRPSFAEATEGRPSVARLASGGGNQINVDSSPFSIVLEVP